MNISRLKHIDRVLGPLLLALLYPIFICLKVFSFFKLKKLKAKHSISILKMLGGGSLLIAYPALCSIRDKYKDSEIILVCTKDVAIYAELLDVFDSLVIIDTSSVRGFISTCITSYIKTIFSDVFINYEIHSKLSCVFTGFTLSKIRIGLFFEWNRWQAKYITDAIFYNPSTPIYTGYQQISDLLGGKVVDFNNAQMRFRTRNGLDKLNKNQKFNQVVLAPYCSSLYKERQFSTDELISIITDKFDFNNDKLLLIGGNVDLVSSNELEYRLTNIHRNLNVQNLVGKTSLLQVVKILDNSDLLITIDSGVIHIARLLGLKTISYWGPSNPLLRLNTLDCDRDKVLYFKIACSPCVHVIDVPPCYGDNICMKQHIKHVDESKLNKGLLIRE
jgi:ADP-heptose:LPS heptosyltransferase